MIFEKYKPLILGLWALFSFSVYSGNIYAKQTENTTVPTKHSGNCIILMRTEPKCTMLLTNIQIG